MIVLNALTLLPVALLCVYGIATRIAGRVFGYWTAFLWVIVPYVAIPMFDQRYHEKYVDITLPQSLGLTVLGRDEVSGDWADTAVGLAHRPGDRVPVGAADLELVPLAGRELLTETPIRSS